jgi:hypothetical protein
MEKIKNLRNKSGQDLDGDGKPDGLSEEDKNNLVDLGREIQEEARGRGREDEDFGLLEYLGSLIVEMELIECPPPHDPDPVPPIDDGSYWEIPWSDPDIDKDGFSRFGSGPIDCNDFDPAVNPGAAETCNHEDDNCNDQIDEGFDHDGDGASQCGELPDCDDNDPSVSPFEPEVCDNFIDDNCNGSVDEDDCVDCADEDGDGFSPVGGPCGPEDCNDADANIYPGAPETAGDGIDHNCNGQDDCFIATAAFGTPLDGRLDILRRFRDRVLLSNPIGRWLVNGYYRISPPVARFIARHDTLRSIIRWCLVPVVHLAAKNSKPISS